MKKLIKAHKKATHIIFDILYNDFNLAGKIIIFPIVLLSYPLYIFIGLLLKD